MSDNKIKVFFGPISMSLPFALAFEWSRGDNITTIRDLCERLGIDTTRAVGELCVSVDEMPAESNNMMGYGTTIWYLPRDLDVPMLWDDWNHNYEIRVDFLEQQVHISEVDIKIIDRPEGFVARESSKDPIDLSVFEKADDDVVILPCCNKVFLATPLHQWFETCLANGGVSSINCPMCRTPMNTLDGFEINKDECIVTVYRAKKKRKVGGDKRKANERDSDFALDDDGNIIYNSVPRVQLRF